MPQFDKARMSQATTGGHARKLYSLFAKDRAAYTRASLEGAAPSAPGQTIVKESYHPQLLTDAEQKEILEKGTHSRPVPEGVAGGGNFEPYARDGDKMYLASKLVALYIMQKKAPGTPATDAGWIYGTVTPEGEVTSAGRVASCMGCHDTSKHDRILR
jgi:hypothetical protein